MALKQQQVVFSSGSGTGIPYTTPPTSHSIGFLQLGWVTTAGTPTVASDRAGETWTLVGSIQDGTGTWRFGAYRCLNMAGGATTITPTLSGATFSGILSEFDGPGFDLGAAGFSSAAGTSSGACRNTYPSGVMTAHFSTPGDSVNTSNGSPGTWTDDADYNVSPGGQGLAHLIAGPNSYSGTGTYGGGSGCAIIIATGLTAPTGDTPSVKVPPQQRFSCLI